MDIAGKAWQADPDDSEATHQLCNILAEMRRNHQNRKAAAAVLADHFATKYNKNARETFLQRIFKSTSDASNLALDCENGRVSLPSGQMVFSPNSIQTVPLPEHPPGTRVTPQHPPTSNVDALLRPRWWSLNTAHLAFIPTQAHFDAHPFNCLEDRSFERSRGKCSNELKSLRLSSLEIELIHIINVLTITYHLPPSDSCISGTAVTCSSAHAYPSTLKQEFSRTKLWFSVYIGHLSYLIAVAMAIDGDDPSKPQLQPTWMSHFPSTDQVLLSGIRSCAANFHIHSRVGVFLNILDPPDGQPSVDFFIKFGIPVYYLWGEAEIKAATTRPRIARLAPLPHQLQQATTTLSHFRYVRSSGDRVETTSSIQDGAMMSSGVDRAETTSSSQDRMQVVAKSSGRDWVGTQDKIEATAPNREQVYNPTPWVAFLERRQRISADIEKQASPSVRQRYSSRRANPPEGKSTEVYEWTTDDAGVYQRVRVDKAENEDTLAEYGKAQKYYDPVLNQWDCCFALGQKTVEELDNARFDGDDTQDLPFVDVENGLPRDQFGSSCLNGPTQDESILTSTEMEVSIPSTPQPATVPFASIVPPLSPPHLAPVAPADSSHLFQIEHLDIIESLCQYYGFTPPSPIPPTHPRPISVTDWLFKSVNCVVGLQTSDETFKGTVLFQFCAQFSTKLESPNSPPPNSLYDLSISNRQYIGRSRRHRFLRQVGEGLFSLVLPQTEAIMPWHVTFVNAADALFVCRLPDDLSDVGICRILLHRGIEFRTLLPHATIPPARPEPLLVPIRVNDYIFTSTDYDAYLVERSVLLQKSRVRRAALMQGGLLWRFAVTEVDFSEVLDGPTSGATVGGFGFQLQAGKNKTMLCDDDFLPGEVELLYGLVYQFTSIKNQCQEVSWWPSPELWKANMGQGAWTEAHEARFIKRLGELRSGKAQPKTASKWRKDLKPPKTWRTAQSVNEEVSSKFLVRTIPSTF